MEDGHRSALGSHENIKKVKLGSKQTRAKEMRRSPFIGAFIIAAIIAALGVISQHRHSPIRCCLDGSRIEPMHEVTIIQRDKSPSKLSCVLSARIWLRENSERVSSIWVTDEITGEKIEAEDAYYVVSEVITTPHTGNKIHVFGQKRAAKLHAREFNGKLIKNPLRVQEKKPVKLVTYTRDSPNSTDFTSPSSQNPLGLVGNTVLIRGQNYSCISQKYPSQLSKGYSSPPDKPPKHFF